MLAEKQQSLSGEGTGTGAQGSVDHSDALGAGPMGHRAREGL